MSPNTMSPNNDHDGDPSRWSRRTVLRMAAAVPVVIVPAVAGPVATAQAKGRPVQATPAAVVIAPVASTFSGMSGPVPEGLRLKLALSVLDDNPGVISFDKLFVSDGVGELLTSSPGVVAVPRSATATVDVGPVAPGQLQGWCRCS